MSGELGQRAIDDAVLVHRVEVGRVEATVVLIFDIQWDEVGERKPGEPLTAVAAFAREQGYGSQIRRRITSRRARRVGGRRREKQ